MKLYMDVLAIKMIVDCINTLLVVLRGILLMIQFLIHLVLVLMVKHGLLLDLQNH